MALLPVPGARWGFPGTVVKSVYAGFLNRACHHQHRDEVFTSDAVSWRPALFRQKSGHFFRQKMGYNCLERAIDVYALPVTRTLNDYWQNSSNAINKT
jgi:hypothetical protein